MTIPKSTEIKAFVPAKDFALAKRFYRQLGFEMTYEGEKVAQFKTGTSQFLLQDFYLKEFAENFMMYLMVEDVDAWWAYIETTKIAKDFAVVLKPPQDYPWGMREIHLLDPTGVLWHIGQNLE